MTKYNDLTGQKYGNLTVIKPSNEILKSGQHKRWICKCDCGKYTTVSSDHLKKGDIKSCGCTKHRGTGTRLYRIWSHMKDRCQNTQSDSYKNYGARGISVCDEWSCSFSTFQSWAFANGYLDKLTLDRIDVNGNYEPINCRWATETMQANNKRTNHLITYKGKTQTLSEWAAETGIKQNTLLYRIKRGWSVEKALQIF